MPQCTLHVFGNFNLQPFLCCLISCTQADFARTQIFLTDVSSVIIGASVDGTLPLLVNDFRCDSDSYFEVSQKRELWRVCSAVRE